MPTASGFSMNVNYTNPLLHPVTDYKTYLEKFTNGKAEDDFSVSTISILDSACLNSLGFGLKIGNRYTELATLTGGSINSICEPFDTSLDNISAKVASKVIAVFHLDKRPIQSSIRVIIDGVIIPENNSDGWSYVSAENKISINGSVYMPSAGSSIVINFDPDLTGGQ